MIKQIKERIGFRRLNNLQKRRTHVATAINYDAITSIGILFDATSEETVKTINKIVSLIPSHIKISALGYYNTKEPKEFQIDNQTLLFIGNTDVNWYFKPNSEKAVNFINTKFDVLMDFSSTEVLSLGFVLCESNAKLIAGCYREESTYDFMIMPGNNDDKVYLFEQIVHYLKMIKTV